jgi:hypothetical protein
MERGQRAPRHASVELVHATGRTDGEGRTVAQVPLRLCLRASFSEKFKWRGPGTKELRPPARSRSHRRRLAPSSYGQRHRRRYAHRHRRPRRQLLARASFRGRATVRVPGNPGGREIPCARECEVLPPELDEGALAVTCRNPEMGLRRRQVDRRLSQIRHDFRHVGDFLTKSGVVEI